MEMPLEIRNANQGTQVNEMYEETVRTQVQWRDGRLARPAGRGRPALH